MRAVPDPRYGRKTKHDHAEVLVCLVAGFLAGKTTIRRSLRWCEKHLEELRGYLPLKNGIASPSTVSRLLSGMDEELFALEFMEWSGEIVCAKGIHLAVDGKALRAAMEKVKDFRAPMVLNAIDAVTGVVLAQIAIKNKDCEIKAIPEVLKLLDIKGNTVTTDAVGTRTRIMEQILSQGGHFVLMAKKNQPQSYEEILKYFGEMSEDHKKMKKDESYRPRYPEMQEKYGRPKPVQDGETGKDIQKTGMISDMELTAEEMGRIKREHRAVENRLHHVLDDTFREDRSPAKKSKNNLALIRKFAYNILRIAILSGDCAGIMTEAMDDFSDDPSLRKKYIFSGIASFY